MILEAIPFRFQSRLDILWMQRHCLGLFLLFKSNPKMHTIRLFFEELDHVTHCRMLPTNPLRLGRSRQFVYLACFFYLVVN
jgi:hypothetical protein